MPKNILDLNSIKEQFKIKELKIILRWARKYYAGKEQKNRIVCITGKEQEFYELLTKKIHLGVFHLDKHNILIRKVSEKNDEIKLNIYHTQEILEKPESLKGKISLIVDEGKEEELINLFKRLNVDMLQVDNNTVVLKKHRESKNVATIRLSVYHADEILNPTEILEKDKNFIIVFEDAEHEFNAECVRIHLDV